MSKANNTIDIWIIHSERKILVTDYPGPPAAICGFVSPEAAQAAKERGHATVSEIGFPVDCHLSVPDWSQAQEKAQEKAKELGYTIKTEDSFDYGLGDFEEEEEDDDDEWEYDLGPEYYSDEYL